MKQRLLDALVWIGIAACCGFLSCALAYPALAQEITTGRGVICDTEEQTRKFATTPDLQAINTEAGSEACAVVLVAFVVGEKHGQVRSEHGVFEVAQILVFAADLGRGWQQVPPFLRFTLFKVKEEVS